MKQHKKLLSNKLSTGILQAIDDVIAVEKTEEFAIDMDDWYRGDRTGGPCEVCFGGAVMARGLDYATKDELLDRVLVERYQGSETIRTTDDLKRAYNGAVHAGYGTDSLFGHPTTFTVSPMALSYLGYDDRESAKIQSLDSIRIGSPCGVFEGVVAYYDAVHADPHDGDSGIMGRADAEEYFEFGIPDDHYEFLGIDPVVQLLNDAVKSVVEGQRYTEYEENPELFKSERTALADALAARGL